MALASCTKQDVAVAVDTTPAVFSTTTTLTRVVSSASASTWEAGDEIGISSTGGDNNVKYTADDTDAKTTFTFADSEQAQILLPRTGTATYSAYYPYQSGSVYTSDLSDQSDLGAIDFLVASGAEGYEGMNGNVNFTFSHALAMVSFAITLDTDLKDEYSDWDTDFENYASLTLGNAATVATYTFSGSYLGTTTTGQIAFNIENKGEGEDKTATAIINPIYSGDDASTQNLSLTIKFDDRVYQSSISLAAAAGKIYNYTLTIGLDEITIDDNEGKGPEIIDWNDYNFGTQEETDYEEDFGDLTESLE